MAHKRSTTAAAAAALFIAALIFIPLHTAQAGENLWGANYFPNVPLTTQDGKVVHFYDDLLKGKIVATPARLRPRGWRRFRSYWGIALEKTFSSIRLASIRSGILLQN